MAQRCAFENSNDVGVFALLTNAYALTALGAAENFHGAPPPACEPPWGIPRPKAHLGRPFQTLGVAG